MKTAAVPQEVPKMGLWDDVLVLVKARLSFLVLITTLVGFLLGWKGPFDWVLLTATLLGTALCAAGSSALNQWWERDIDAQMKRTMDRPLPARRMRPVDGLLFGLFFSTTGLAILALFTNWDAAFLAFATIAIYILVYTPMKRISSLNTLVGAVPGALPPLIGWMAARGNYDLEGCLLFGILWFWQMPHFLAIAWMYKDDYAQGGFVMLTANDPECATTSRQALLYSICLLLVTLVPGVLGFNSPVYFFGALVLGLVFSGFALIFIRRRDRHAARNLFFASIVYLPVLLGLLVATKR
ncbi:MAG: protoheme IX farnesyltransferase [Spartobacteria bacterium Tous-C9RFEB]|jgi:protoheme IX farnesyltransferase|nr:MAG: protoheme IX farnesyltransferase [Spartobacteria bacterium Tous-C9RFEB]